MAANANFCTLNANAQISTGTFSHGNTLFQHTSNAWRSSIGTFALTSGKWYWEALQTADESGNGFPIGIYDLKDNRFASNQEAAYPSQSNSTYGEAHVAYTYHTSTRSSYRTNGTETSFEDITPGAAGDVWQCAFDADNGKLYFGKNNSWDNSGNPATGTNPTATSLSISPGGWTPITCSYNSTNSESYIQNFGQDSSFAAQKSTGTAAAADGNGYGDFYYAPPSGFLSICSANTPTATAIDPIEEVKSSEFFDVVTYTGDGGTSTSITGLGFQPDWVLIKNRDTSDDWCNQNSVTGVGKTNAWNSAGGYTDETDCITAFNSDGWTMNNDHKVNANTEKYVAYCWKKSADAGFDIVEYSGTGTTNNVSHSLGATPDCIMVTLKSGTNWDSTMYFNSPGMGSTEGIFMTLANGKQTTTYFPSVTSSTFRPDSSANTSTRTYVAYLFKSIDGFSKFGQFEGNSDADGPFIYTGFKPRFVFIKAIDASENWQIRDTARLLINNGTALRIYWNTNGAEGSSTASPIDFLGNGFKIRGSNSEVNTNTIIYGAWGSVPYKFSSPLST